MQRPRYLPQLRRAAGYCLQEKKTLLFQVSIDAGRHESATKKLNVVLHFKSDTTTPDKVAELEKVISELGDGGKQKIE